MALLRRPAALLLVTALIALGGCDAMAIGRPGVPLDVRTQPGEATVFEPDSVTAAPNTLVLLTFSNVAELDHNLVFLDPITVRTREIVRPGESDRFEFETPAAGTYQFVCTIHEGMTGTLVVR